jgi:hypothetical protein
MKKITYFIPVVPIVLFLFGLPAIASAATFLHFEAPTGTIAAGSVFAIHATIDADQSVNAYDLTIAYHGPVQVRAVDDAHSIVTVWQNQPTAQNGTIALRGGSLAPFSGSGGELATIYISAEASGTATFSFINSFVYAANGQGTTIIPKTTPVTVTIIAPLVGSGSSPEAGAGASSTFALPGVPASAPQISFLGIIRDPSSNNELLSFLTSDAGSGVAGTFVRYRTAFVWGSWQPATDYALVPPGAWEVGFRVTNNDGVSVERTLYDGKNLAIVIGELAGGILVIVGAIAIWMWRKHRRSLAG